MKPHLPAALFTALLAALPLTQTLRAETLFATGASTEQLVQSSRFSDTGKGCYFNESYNYYQPYKGAEELYKENGNWDFMGSQLAPSVNRGSSSVSGALGGLTHDVSMCWANATANVMQYWQSYYGVFYDDSNGALPYGWNYAPELAETLGGSQSLSIYNEFYRHWYDEGGTFKWASDWYCRRVDPSRTYIKDEGTGGWWENWFGESHAYSVSYYNGSSNIKTLTNNFAAALGYTAQEDGTWAQTTVGQIGYLGISSYLGGHALTCWGMETDENNLVKAIYIANSDDLSYQLVKLYLKSVDGQYYLFSDEECSEYWNWNAANWYLDEVSYLNTPQALKDLYREYSSAELTWTGVAAEWSESASADRRIGYELPGRTAGWTLTVQGKSYDSYFDTRRNVRFDDSAARTDIRTGGQLTAGNVVLANSKQTYTFTAGKDGCRLTADSLTAETNGSAVFNGMDTAANTLLLNGYSLTVQNGTLSAGTATLQGGAALTLENSTATFADLLLGSGTVLTLDLSRAGDETALMSISGTMVTEGGLTLNVHNLPTDLSELYMVISAGRYDESLWNSQSVTLNGAAADQLFWRDGVLYFGSYVDKQHQYFTAHTAAPDKWRKFEGLSFTGIRYQGNGAALTNAATLRLEKNGPVLFEDNRATGSGGAVANSGSLAAEGNKSITFRRNQATETGGAVANTGGGFSITGSQNVLFDANNALAGGALYQSGGSTAVSGNGSVSFSNNRATEAGGAVMNEGGTLQLTGNEALSFTANHADGNGGAVYNAGGRLSVSGGASFTRNSAGGQGGAVYNAYDGRIALNADTGNIIFRGNTQGSGSNTVLRAIHSQGDLNSDDLKESVSAAAGHSVIFYDAVRVENSSWFGQTNFNTEGSGSIVFSGRYAAEDLQSITGSAPTAAALRDSRSSVFTGSIYLAGGTLRIEDGASLTTGSLYTADGAVPVTLALANGELHTPDYSLTFGTFKALELTGTNTVETSYMAFFDESALTFNLSAEHAETAALTVLSPDRFDMQGNLTLNLNGTDALAGGRYKLIETSHGVLWDCNLTLNGGYAEALRWENGTLWYDAAYIPIPVPSTDLEFGETLSGSFRYSGNDSLTFTTGKSRAIDETGSDPAEVLLAENGSLTIRDINTEGSGGAIANVSHGADSPSVIVLEGNGPIDFNTVKAADDGGIIANISLNGGEARIDFRRNGAMQLLGGRAAEGRGGAVFNAGQLNMADNGEIMLGDSSAAKDGGAVYNAAGGLLNITENGGLNLARNATDGRGGAVANYGELHLDGNNYIVATGNYSLYGAALYNEGRLSMDGNGYIQFAGNDCVDNTGDYSVFGIGGNICNSAEGDISICDNGNVSLSSTYAMYGGGMYNEGRVIMANNRDVNMDSNSTEGNGGAVFNYGGTFVLSRNRNVTFNEDWAWGGYGGTICNMAGTVELNANESLSVYSSYCALSNGNTSAEGEAVMDIIGNGDIVFYDNISYQTKDRFKGKAGAVYNHANGTLSICGNGNVVFYNNTVLQFAEASPTGKDRSYLHALHNEGTLNLSAAAGKSITFYDGIDSAAGSAVNLNAVYTDAEGQVQTATGDIVFSGLRAESILRGNMLAEYVTPEAIAMSKTSTLETEVKLYGGCLRVEDDARLITNALTARAGSGSTVRLSGASLTATGALTLQSGTALQVEGVNSITAGTVNMQAGSTLAFEVGKINLTQSALTLTGKLNTDHVTLSFIGTEDLQEGSTYALLTAQGYQPAAWTQENITVSTNGVLWEDLEWRSGTLYLNFAKHPTLTTTWNNTSGDGIWQANSANWGGKDAYTDGAEVIFADKGVGTVTLVGDLAPKSVLVDSSGDYLFAGKGKLTGNTSLTKLGQGTLTITTANDYTGMTTVNGGTLVAGNARALGSGIVALNGGTLEIAADGISNTLTAAGHSSLQVDQGYQLTLNEAIANNGVLTVSGTVDASALTLNTTAATHLDVNGNSGASGFAKSAGYAVQVVNGGSTVNNGAVVMHGTHALTLNSDGSATSGGVVDDSTYLLTGRDAAASSAIHAVSGKAAVSMNGGTLTVNDAVTVNATGGSIALKGGTLNGTVRNTAVTATGDNALNGGHYTLSSAIANNGTLTVSGTVDASALTLNTTAATHVDVNGNSGASGFAKEAAYSVKLVSGGTVVNNGATVTHGTRTLELGGNGIATAGGDVHYDNYLLTGTGTATSSAIHGVNSTAAITQTGGTLTVDDTATVNATAGNIILQGGTLKGKLNNTALTATGGTLAADVSGSKAVTINGKVQLNGSVASDINLNGGSLTTKELMIANGQSLNFNGGGICGAVSTAEGGNIVLGAQADIDGDLTLDGGQLLLNGNLLTVDGTLNLFNSTEVDISKLGIGEYKLLTFGDLNGSLDNLSVHSELYRTEWNRVDNALMLEILAMNDRLHWTAASGTWKNGARFGEGVFDAEDDVFFATPATVTISGVVTPGSVAVENTAGTVTLKAANTSSRMAGETSLTKNGAGALVLNNGNTYTGGTTINAGTVTAGGVTSFGTGEITLNGGTLNLGKYAVTNPITVNGPANLKGTAYKGALTINGNLGSGTNFYLGKTAVLNSGKVSGVLTGAAGVSVKGEGTLAGKNTYKGTTSVQAGGLLHLTGTVAGNISVSGTLDSSTRTLTPASGKTLTVNNGGVVKGLVNVASGRTLVLKGTESSVGSINLNAGTAVFDSTAAAQVFSGTGVFSFNGHRMSLKTKSTVKSAAATPMTLESGSITLTSSKGYSGPITLNGGKLNLGKIALASPVTVDGTANLIGSAYKGALTVNGTLAGSTNIYLGKTATLNGGTVKGILKGKGGVIVRGESTLANKNTYTGTTNIQSGATLHLPGSVAGNIVVNSDATLDNTKAVSLTKGRTMKVMDGATVTGGITVGSGATLAVYGDESKLGSTVINGGTAVFDSTAAAVVGTGTAALTVHGKKITVKAKSTLKMAADEDITLRGGKLVLNSTSTTYTGDLLAQGGTLDLASRAVKNDVYLGNAVLMNGNALRGTLHVQNANSRYSGSLTLTSAQKLDFEAGSKLTVSGTLTLKGGTALTLSGDDWEEGQYTIMTCGKLSGKAATAFKVTGAEGFDSSIRSSGRNIILTLTAIPEAKHSPGLTTACATLAAPELTTACETLAEPELTAAAEEPQPLALATEEEEETLAAEPDTYAAMQELAPTAEALVQSDWALVDTTRAFTASIRNRSMGTLTQDGKGAIWANAIGSFSRHGSVNGHSGSQTNVYGGSIGAEHVFGEHHTLGVALGSTHAMVGGTSLGKLRQNATHLALYGNSRLGSKFSADWAAAFGTATIHADMGANRGKWEQNSGELTARLTYTETLSERTALRTFAGLDYDATGADRVNGYKTGSVQALRGELGIGLTHAAENAVLYAEIGMVGDMVRHNPTVESAHFRLQGANPGRTGFKATLGGSMKLNDTWSANAAYNLETAAHATQQSVNVGVSRKF